jgi:hypothetical protein
MGLPIPNYRQVLICPELAEAWIATGGRFIEPGIGFGSQYVPGAVECDPELTPRVSAADATQVLAFDWWIRNSDRIRSNPNLLWSHDTDQHYLIDHEKAGNHEDSAVFWHDHLFAGSETWMTAEIHARMKAALPHIPDIVAELPPEWTSSTRGLDWFATQLTNRIEGTPHKEWRAHEEPTVG